MISGHGPSPLAGRVTLTSSGTPSNDGTRLSTDPPPAEAHPVARDAIEHPERLGLRGRPRPPAGRARARLAGRGAHRAHYGSRPAQPAVAGGVAFMPAVREARRYTSSAMCCAARRAPPGSTGR